MFRACFDQRLIAIRSPGTCGDHVRLDTSRSYTLLVSLTLSDLLYKLPLTDPVTRHLATVINCTMLHGGEDRSCGSTSSQLCSGENGDQREPECMTQQWVVTGHRKSGVSYYQTNCSGGHEVGCKLATGVDAPTFTVRLTQNVLYNGSLLTVDECQ